MPRRVKRESSPALELPLPADDPVKSPRKGKQAATKASNGSRKAMTNSQPKAEGLTNDDDALESKPKRQRRGKKEEPVDEAPLEVDEKPKKRSRKAKREASVESEEVKPKAAKRSRKAEKVEGAGNELEAQPKARKRKAKQEDGGDGEAKPRKRAKKADPLDFSAYPFPSRNFESKKYVGAHTSASGGAHFAVTNALKIGARAFGVFTKNQRQWAAKPLSEDTLRLFPKFAQGLDAQDSPLADGKGIDTMKATVCHCSYLVNLSSPVETEWTNSVDAIVIEAQRCDDLGIGFLVFHPGSTKGQCTHEDAIKSIAKGINQVISKTKNVTILVENMAGSKSSENPMGDTPEELAAILALVEDTTRVGVCFDTCHAFAAGYDMRTPEAYDETMKTWDDALGLDKILAIHCNDSKEGLGNHRDLHHNIGVGHLGLQAFALLMSDERFDGRPIILETPMLDGTLNPDGAGGGCWTAEITLLHRLEQLGGRSATPLTDDPQVKELFDQIKSAVTKSEEEAATLKAAKQAKKLADKAAGIEPKKKKGKKAAVEADETENEEAPDDEDV